MLKNKLMAILLMTTGSLVIACGVYAQLPAPRPADHFWRKKTLSRIDLDQKVNKPVAARSLTVGEQYNEFTERNGLITTLLDKYESGAINGYNPDAMAEAQNYAQMTAKCFPTMKKDGEKTDEPEIDTEVDETEDIWEDEPTDDKTEGAKLEEALAPQAEITVKDELLMGAGKILEVVEDQIFDKNKSTMQVKPEFIRIVWVDPAGEIPEKLIVAFKYDDVAQLMSQTQAANRHNDAAALSMKNLFELRNFDAYNIDISGVQPLTLKEAELRRQQIIEFEHHLWSF